MSFTESDTVEIPRAQFERLLDRVNDLETELAEYRAANERDKASIRQRFAGDDHSAAVDDAEARPISAVADELRQEISRLREIVREQGETIKEQNDRIDELEHENAESTENETKDAQDLVEVRTDKKVVELDDVWIAGLPFGKVLNAVRTTIQEDGGLIDRIIDLEEGGVRNGETAEGNDGRSPLAQLIDLPAETANDALTANQERGRRIAQRAKELGTNTPEGFVVKSSDIATQLKKWGESTHSETVSRIMDFIIDLGKNDVYSTIHKGRRILVFDPDRVRGYGSGAEPDVIKSRRDVIWSRESTPDPAPA